MDERYSKLATPPVSALRLLTAEHFPGKQISIRNGRYKRLQKYTAYAG